MFTYVPSSRRLGDFRRSVDKFIVDFVTGEVINQGHHIILPRVHDQIIVGLTLTGAIG